MVSLSYAFTTNSVDIDFLEEIYVIRLPFNGRVLNLTLKISGISHQKI